MRWQTSSLKRRRKTEECSISSERRHEEAHEACAVGTLASEAPINQADSLRCWHITLYSAPDVGVAHGGAGDEERADTDGGPHAGEERVHLRPQPGRRKSTGGHRGG